MAIYNAPESLHVGTGTETVFGFNWPYLLPRDLVVTVNGQAVPTVLASPNQVVVVPAPAALAIVRIYRNTPAQNPTYLFATGIPMLPKYIDGNNKQLLYALQEGLLQFANTQAIAEEALLRAAAAEVSAAQQARDIRRTLRVATTEPELILLPSVSARSGKLLGFDAVGQPVGSVPASGSGAELALDLAGPNGTSLVGYKQPAASGPTLRLAPKVLETASAREFGILSDDDPAETAARINTALLEISRSPASSKELLFLDTAHEYLQDTPLIMRDNVSLVGRAGRQVRLRNTRTVYDYYHSCNILPGNFHPDFTQRLVYTPLQLTVAGSVQVVLAAPGAFNAGDSVVIASNEYYLTGGLYKCPRYMFLNEVLAVTGNVLLLRYPIDTAFAGGIVRLDGTQEGRNGVPLFFWKDGEVRDLTFSTAGRYHGDTATLGCAFKDVTVRARSYIYGNTFQHTHWVRPRGLVGSGNEHSLCSLHCTVTDANFSYDPVSAAPANSAFLGFQENTRDFKYRGLHVDFAGYVSSTAFANFINTQDCAVEDFTISTGSGWTGSDAAFNNTGAVGRVPCKSNKLAQGTFTGVSRFRNLDFSGDGTVGTVADNTVEQVVFRGAVSSECIRYTNVVDVNTVHRAYLPSKRPLIGNTSHSLVLTECTVLEGFNTQADPDIYTRNDMRRNKTGGFQSRLTATRYLLNQLPQSGTTPLHLLDANVGTSLNARDTLDFEMRGNLSGTAGTKAVVLELVDNSDSSVVPLLRKEFLAATTGAFVISGSIYVANLSLLVSEMDVYTSAGAHREMLQGTSVAALAGRSVTLRVTAVCSKAGDGMSFQKFKSDLTNPMLA